MTATTRRISQHNLHQRLALQGPRDELKELADTIDGLLARLEAAFEAQRRFVANASHELRTPLAMMRTSLDVATAKPEPLPDELKALDGKLREGLDRADSLLESFLTLARADNESTFAPITVSLRDLVACALAQRSEAIDQKQISVCERLADVSVIGDEALLARMIENVVDNAIRHNEAHGFIRAETQTEQEMGRLTVQTGGPLLEQETVGQLGQPFRRLGTERSNDSRSGVGLGLSIVAAIARAHGGTLELRAREGGGLVVTIDLPLAQPGVPP